MRFTGKVVLVAGGTGGLGRVVSLSFLEEGAKVIVTYREQKEFDAIKTEAGANGSAIEGHHTDVTDETAVRQLLDKVLAEIFGGKSVSPPNAEQNSRLITVPTRGDPEELAKQILEMFRRGFGMSENMRCQFHLSWGAE